MLESWLPRNYKLTADIIIKNIVFSGDDWQIYVCSDGSSVLIAKCALADYWCSTGYIAQTLLQEHFFGQEQYFFLHSPAEMFLAPITHNQDFITYEDGKSFATALTATRKVDPDISLSEGIFVERYSKILPIKHENKNESDNILLGRWLSRGINIPASSVKRMMQLLPTVTESGLADILQTAHMKAEETTCSPKQIPTSFLTSSEPKPKAPFSLPGRIELETFFKEHIIDIIENAEAYKAMGIDFPTAFILQGPPGCGKTYAVEQLIEYLEWPSFFVDSGSIGSPYIHETSKRISAVFDEAIENAPAVLVIDEMESFLMDRAGSANGSGHHVEEVAEFLRRIPEAAQNRVLVVAMTNMVSSIDPAIRRKGRFDHIIEVGMPSKEEIAAVISHGLDKVPHDTDIDVDAISEALMGHPISDVSFVLREAARITAKAHKKAISNNEFLSVLSSFEKNMNSKQKRRQIGFAAAESEKK
jgi:cell division protease FtsH